MKNGSRTLIFSKLKCKLKVVNQEKYIVYLCIKYISIKDFKKKKKEILKYNILIFKFN